MKILQNKYINRLSLVFTNSLSSIAVPAVNVLFSILVVRSLGAARWGEFVYYFLWASLASFVLNWGNKDHLLREFSKRPAEIPGLWRESFFTRSVLIIPMAGVMFISFPIPESLLLIQWMAAIFIAQSFEVLTVYHRRYLAAFFTEAAAGIFLLVSLYFKIRFDIYTTYLFYILIRCGCYIVIFRKDVFKNFDIKFRFRLLKGSFLFFLLGLSGLLGSRVDQYCASVLLSKEDLGRYQVLKSFLLYFQALAGFIILPYVKNIYRLNDKSVDKIINRLFLTGIILTVPVIFIFYIILEDIYHFSFPFETYLYSALFVLPAFYYLTVLYKFFKDNKNKLVLIFNLAGTAVLLLLSVILIPGFKINGALIAGIASGWSVAILYFIYNRKYFGK